MLNKTLKYIILLMFLTACAPKFNYLNSQVSQPSFNRILVVVDYLHMVDDVGKLFDYPENKNKKQLRRLRTIIESMLKDKGFKGTIDFAIVSSGLGLNPENGFEHYINGKRKEELIYPPFIFNSDYSDSNQKQFIDSFAYAQDVAFVPVSKKTTNYYTDLRMTPIVLDSLDESVATRMEFGADVGVLHIRAVMPKVSFMKAMGVGLLSAGLTAGISGGSFVGVSTPIGIPHSTGLLFDNQTGRVVWKTQLQGDVSQFSKKYQMRFFEDFPQL